MKAAEVNEKFATVRRHARALALCNRLVRRAALYDLWRKLRRKETDLICFAEAMGAANAYQKIRRGIRSVPVRQIVGSVGRSRDFTREFLPRACVNQERWSRIALAFTETCPVVQLYQVGEVYFVVDGHHRISVAYARGCQMIEADITEVVAPPRLLPESIRTSLGDMAQGESAGKQLCSLVMPFGHST